MAVGISGNRGLNFTANLNISEAKRNALELKQVLASLGIAPAGTSGFTAAQAQMSAAMRQSQAETQRLIQEGVRLRNEYEQGRITAQQLAAQTRLLNEQRRAEAAALKEARKAQVAATGSYKEAQQRLKQLGEQIRSVSGGFTSQSPLMRARIEEYRRLNAQLTEFDRRMGNNQRNVGNYQSALNGLKGLAATYLGATAIIGGINKIIQSNAELSDSLSDVRRTAGLTGAEAEKLAEQLKKIDTRTSLKGLLDIAIIGGQLGIAKDQLAGFTKAVDQLAVSLSGELQGGAEGIAKSLGVLDNVFGITQKNAGNVEKSFNQIGSAILGLGQSGLATGDFLTDFGERVGGLAKQAGLSLPVILSYGAVLQENGVSAEVAGSSFKRLLSSLATNRQKFLAVAQLADANLTLKSFTNIINTDAKKALDLFFAGLVKGGTTTSSFNDILKSLKLSGAGVSQTIAALSNGQASLNGHIQDATKDFNEATLSAEQFALKNDNLAGSIDKLSNSFTNATTNGKISGFFKLIVDGLTGTVSALDRVTNSQSWKSFFLRVGGGLLGTGDVSATALDEISKYKDMTDVERAMSLFKDLDDAKKKQKLLDQTVYRDKAYEQATQLGATKQTIANYNREQAILKALRQEYRGLGTDKVKAGQGGDPATINTTTKAEAKAVENALNAQRTLQAKIDELKDKGKRKALDDDAEEIEAVKAKYAKLREEAERFNKNPKNKGLKVDSSGLLKAESTETDTLIDKQASVKLKATLEDQKKIYDEFEKYKSEVGLDKAKERYASQIDTDLTYLEKLKQLENNILDPQKSKGADVEYDGKSEQQLAVINKLIEEEKVAEQRRYDALLKQFMDYSQKRAVLIENYNKDYADLAKDPKQQAERTKIYEKDLKELDDANAKKLESYQALFTGIESMSRRSALNVLQNARVQLEKDIKSGKIVDPDEIAKVKGYFNEVEGTIKNGAGEALIGLARQVDDIASSVGGIDSAFGKVVSTLGNVLGQVGNVKKGFSDLKQAQDTGSLTGQLTAGLGIFGAGFSIFQSVVSFFNKEAQREEQQSYARDLQNKQTEALNKALERQVALLDDVYGTERIKDYSAAIKQAQENQAKYAADLVGKYTLTGDKQLDDLITKINNGEQAQFGVLNSEIIKKNQAQFDALKLPADIVNLQRLLDEGKLDANTATIVTNLIKAKETAEQLVNNLRAETVGTTLSQIADDFISTLTDGTQDFGKTFEQTIQKSLLNGFKGEVIRKQLQAFYTQFAQLSEDGLSSDEIEKLRLAYLTASEKAKKDLEALSKATGIDLTKDASSDNGSSVGTIQRQVTEATASEGNAIARATYDINKRMAAILSDIGKTNVDLFVFSRDNFAIQQKIEANTFRTANNTDLLNTKLDNIERAIKGTGSTAYDRGK